MIDARRFESASQSAGTTRDPGAAGRLLDDALALWRGPALEDVAFESFAQGEIARLEELRLAALEARMDTRLSQGQHALVMPELEQLSAEHPSRGRLVGLLMLALYRCGRQTDALAAYREGRRPQRGVRARALARAASLGGSNPPPRRLLDAAGRGRAGAHQQASSRAAPAVREADRRAGAGDGDSAAARPPEGTVALLLRTSRARRGWRRDSAHAGRRCSPITTRSWAGQSWGKAGTSIGHTGMHSSQRSWTPQRPRARRRRRCAPSGPMHGRRRLASFGYGWVCTSVMWSGAPRAM